MSVFSSWLNSCSPCVPHIEKQYVVAGKIVLKYRSFSVSNLAFEHLNIILIHPTLSEGGLDINPSFLRILSVTKRLARLGYYLLLCPPHSFKDGDAPC